MKFVFIVILFVGALAVFTLLAGFGYRTSVEKELRGLALTSLEEGGYDGVDVKFDYLHARVEGEVDSAEDRVKVIELLKTAVPTGIFPPPADAELAIRPTMHPELSVVREAGGNDVSVAGVLASSDESAIALIGGRLHSLDSVETINNAIELDPRRFNFPGVAEMASLACQLIEASESADVRLQGNILSIRGEVENDGLKASLLDLAQRVGAGEVVDDIAVAEPVALRKPSYLKMTRNRFGVTISGMVADDEDKAALLDVFETMDPPVRLSDKLEVSRTHAPALWESHASAIIPVLLSRFSGELTTEFSAETVRLTGRVEGQEARDEILASFRPLSELEPPVELLTEIEVRGDESGEAAAVHLVATYEGELLSLDGILPQAAFVEALESRLETSFPNISVKNELTVADSTVESPWIANLVEFFEELVARTDSAKLELEGEQLILEGMVKAASDKQILQNIAINSLPEGTIIESALMSEEDLFPQLSLLPEVRTQVSESLKALPVYFDSGSEIVKSSQLEKVDAMIKILTDTGASPKIVVTGFADNVGNAEYNRQLSLRRANGVAARLIAGKIAEEDITVETKGEDVSNVSRSDRWKSRRVEVALAPPETPEEAADEPEAGQ